MNSNHRCPICHGESSRDRLVPDWGEMRRCDSCRLVFAHPMTLPESPESLYGKAYEGLWEKPGMEGYLRRMSEVERIKEDNLDLDSRILTSSGARHEAMAWLKRSAPPGSVVLDVGCSLGYFLSRLRRNGFTAVGMEVAKKPVDALREEGFEVWHGTIDSIPHDWKQPQVVTSFFVLHHLTDPVGFLSTIRDKFPEATLMVGVWNRFPSPQDLSPASFPPRTLTWWSPNALKEAMKRAGYEVESVAQFIHPYEFGTPRIARRRLSEWTLSSGHHRLHSIYHAVKPKLVIPWKLWKRLRGKSSSVLVIGRPAR